MEPRDRVVDAAVKSLRVPSKLATASRTLLNGLWLGVLSDVELAALDERYYDEAAAYRTVAWNERGLFDWERQMVEAHFGGCGRVVVTSAGGGREVLALAEMGFDVVGYESHPGLMAFARDFLAERGHAGRIRPAPRDVFPTDVGAYDGLVVGWGAYSLIHDRARRVRFLEAAGRDLSNVGPVLLSYFERQRDSRELRWTTALANRLRGWRGVTPVALGDTLAPNLVHAFTGAELAEELGAAGLRVATQWTTGNADNTVSYACAVARPT